MKLEFGCIGFSSVNRALAVRLDPIDLKTTILFSLSLVTVSTLVTIILAQASNDKQMLRL